MDEFSQGDICRVCRSEGSAERPLFYPCICTGSIKYIHQECLMQWMRYSHKEFCELCGHRFGFQPIYSPDMPRVLPLKDLLLGLLAAVLKCAKFWFHYSLVGAAWFGFVPLTAYRTYRLLFQVNTFEKLLSMPFSHLFSLSNIPNDILYGFFVVLCTLLSFIALVWLREQILRGGGPDWLEREVPQVAAGLALGAAANAANANGENAGENAGAAADVAGDEDEEEVFEEALAEPQLPEGIDAPEPVPAQPAAAPNRDVVVDVPMDNGAPPVAADPAENEGEAPLDQAPAADNDDFNWNPMDWDRAAEELTWDRLLGLDGSLFFLEHVFWIISLNTLFIISFAFLPYSFGKIVLYSLSVARNGNVPLHGLITTLVGYCFIGVTLLVLHFLAQIFRLRRLRWFIGICYIVVKVALLCVSEVVALPLACGWWLDICSLPLFDATMKQRRASFAAAPGTSLFMHWLYGMVYVYYFAAFLSILREVLRPGVLWILRNVNDPDFSPIQEMIHVSIMMHIRRLITSAMIFGCSVLLILWVPIRLLQTYWPSFLPYTLSGDSEVNDMSLQVILLQIVLPGFFEQTQTRTWLKAILRCWCRLVARLLDIHSYLLGNVDAGEERNIENNNLDEAPPAQDDVEEGDNAAQQQQAEPHRQPLLLGQNPRNHLEQNLGGAFHRAFRHIDGQANYEPFERPTLFPLRIFALMILVCLSLVAGALLTITVPITIGRYILQHWLSNPAAALNKTIGHNGGSAALAAAKTSENWTRPHELYTAEIGVSLCWLVARITAMAISILPQGRQAIIQRIKQWLHAASRYALPVLIIILMVGVIPLMFGTFMELAFNTPVRVRLRDTPLHSLWQYWFVGVFYTKLGIGTIMVGPDWFLRRNLERAYHDGLRNIDVHFLIRDLAWPVIMGFGLSLAVPYAFAKTFVTPFIENPYDKQAVLRLSHSIAIVIVGSCIIFVATIRQFKTLYTSIKVDKYLVGQQLVNYERHKTQQDTKAIKSAEAASAAPNHDNPPPALPEHEQNVENAKREETEEQQLVLARQHVDAVIRPQNIVEERDEL